MRFNVDSCLSRIAALHEQYESAAKDAAAADSAYDRVQSGGNPGSRPDLAEASREADAVVREILEQMKKETDELNEYLKNLYSSNYIR